MNYLIRPELLAGKIESGWLDDAALQHAPRAKAQINELLWFLQWRSACADGLSGLVNELIDEFPGEFCSRAMAELPEPENGIYTLEQCLRIWAMVTDRPLYRPEQSERYLDPNRFDDFCLLHIGRDVTAQSVLSGPDADRAQIMSGCQRFNRDFLLDRFQSLAMSRLPNYLMEVCTRPDISLNGQSYCPRLVQVLFDHLERRAASVAGEIAETQVSRRIFGELQFALSQTVPVRIIGDSRIGKTSPASVWCRMRPGRARLITVPETNRMSDFIEAHADALGIDHSAGMSIKTLERLVRDVHEASGLMLVYDEASFLIPANYTKATPPARLEFVRFRVIDRDLPCAFFATPQSYKQTLEQYVKTTGYRIEQWLGRLCPAVILPPDLDREDLMAIARKHFPQMPVPFLKLICAKAMLSEGYIKNMEFAAKRALFIAGENGRVGPLSDDVRQAIKEMMPGTVPPDQTASSDVPVPARKSPAARRGEIPVAVDIEESIDPRGANPAVLMPNAYAA